jgi:hypothetical protein
MSVLRLDGRAGAGATGGKVANDNTEEAIRLTAYFLWEQDGRPEGREEEYWQRARERQALQRACDRMLEENRPEGDASGDG